MTQLRPVGINPIAGAATIEKRMSFRIKRAYETPSPADGLRVLVDRLWPRGITKADAKIDQWLKELAPSTALRKWFGHDAARWTEFVRRYSKELDSQPAALAGLRKLGKGKTVTLVYGAKDTEHNQAVALKESLQSHA